MADWNDEPQGNWGLYTATAWYRITKAQAEEVLERWDLLPIVHIVDLYGLEHHVIREHIISVSEMTPTGDAAARKHTRLWDRAIDKLDPDGADGEAWKVGA